MSPIETESEYHAKKYIMSSHRLCDFMRSPWEYHQKHVLGNYKKEDSDAFSFGRLVHKVVLEPEKVLREISTDEPINEKTGKPYGKNTKKYNDWLDSCKKCGKISASLLDLEYAKELEEGIVRCAPAVELLTDGYAEVILRGELCGVQCQARADWITETSNGTPAIVDLKTCRDIDGFKRDVNKYGYRTQAAFYSLLFKKCFGMDCEFFNIAVEKRVPAFSKVFRYSLEKSDFDFIEDTLYRYKASNDSKVWSVGSEFIETL